MANIKTNWTGGTPPRNTAHPAAPEPVEAVAGAPSTNGADFGIYGVASAPFGVPSPRPLVIMVGDRNLVDIITELQTLLP